MSDHSDTIYDSTRRRFPALEELIEILNYRNLVVQLVRRDLTTRYKRSVLGVAWTMLNPLGTMLILTIVFANAFGSGPEYATYVLSGLIAWNFFAQTTNAAMLHLVWGEGLLKRIYIPRTVFSVSAAGTGLVNLALALVPLVLVMLVTGVPIRPSMLYLPVAVLFLACFALGLGLLISTIAVYFADVADMYAILLTAWLYLSPVIYPPEILPPAIQPWIETLNPMYTLIMNFRIPIYDGVLPPASMILTAALIAFTTLIVGWIFFTSRADEFAYRL
jgi:ABC-type polysaccharide/polyol phosphate export permease